MCMIFIETYVHNQIVLSTGRVLSDIPEYRVGVFTDVPKKGTLSECVPPGAAFQIPLLTESVDAARAISCHIVSIVPLQGFFLGSLECLVLRT